MDFDDLLLFPLTLFAERPNAWRTGSGVSITSWWMNARTPNAAQYGS